MPRRGGGKPFGKGRPGGQRPAWRDRETAGDGPVILYGWHTVTMALQNRQRRIRKLFLTENAARRLAEENIETRVTPEMVRPSQIDEDPAHDLGGCSEEMRPVLPVGTLGIHQMKVGLVHQRRGLERMSPTLVPHVPAGNTAKLVVDQGRQAIERRLVAATPRADEGGNLD